MLQNIIYGGQNTEHDFHKTGFYQEFLELFLHQAGFCNVTRVKNFGMFEDTSMITFHKQSISLNVIAHACK